MRPLLSIVFCTAVMLAASLAFAQTDDICSIWVNQDYASDKQPPKIIFNYDGTVETYPSQDAKDPISRGIFQVVEQWSDAQGVAWYKLKMIDMYGTELYLVRITKEGGRLEFVHQPYEYPQKIDETEASYCTYTRTPSE